MKVHHIGYLIKNIEKSRDVFIALGYREISEKIYDDFRKVYICFLEKDGYMVELISPACGDSIVSGLMKQYKNSAYHICYSSDNLNADLEHCANMGFVQIGEPCAAPAIGGRRVVFLVNASIGMIEIVEI